MCCKVITMQPESSVDEVIEFASKINSNSHGISDYSIRYNMNATNLLPTTLGIGLFPLGCIFNHSCCPNVEYVGDKYGRLTFKSTKDVKQGEELFISYIPLFDLTKMGKEEGRF